MTIRQARASTATGLKFGDPIQIEALRVMALGAEIWDINHVLYRSRKVIDMEEKFMLEMLEVLKNT